MSTADNEIEETLLETVNDATHLLNTFNDMFKEQIRANVFMEMSLFPYYSKLDWSNKDTAFLAELVETEKDSVFGEIQKMKTFLRLFDELIIQKRERSHQ